MIKRYLLVWWRYLVLNLKMRLHYRVAFWIEILFNLSAQVINLLFWKVIFLRLRRFAGWDTQAVIVLLFCNEIFLAIFISFFSGTRDFQRKINRGDLDKFLTSPLESRFHVICSRLAPIRLVRSVPVQGFLLFMMYTSGYRPPLLPLVGSIAVIGLAALSFGMIQLTFNYFAFWWGKSDALIEFLDTALDIIRFPLDLLPKPGQMLLTFGMPIIFASTFPALFILSSHTASTYYVSWIAMEILALVFWTAIQACVWRQGILRYESYGG